MKKILNFPILRQTYDYDCGACVVQSVLDYYGIDVKEGEIMKLAKTTKRGTNINEIKKVLKYFNIRYNEGKMNTEQLKKCIDKKIPVIIPIQAWSSKKKTNWKKDWRDGHYVIVIGYSKDRIYFEDPDSERRDFLLIKELEERWHDVDIKRKKLLNWGLIVHRNLYAKDPHPIISRDYKKYGKRYKFNENQVIHMG